ncbi:marine proteobacterial sortase target protein [Pseudoalteromonas sp. MMG010]|uniref:marine proteobacterial sortase target protein n=1 Tax=Pseudoalteromonas sp. MMG010 TaxID=2822685 RepID=UPI001B39E098|nr:marine proteobacterial sortase target protein [Pseudoalteromonas sp. MMG010]MBQ4832010.1 marine proteobacterial sortase target protein [Pseudoalteromonas sp. MMG010]
MSKPSKVLTLKRVSSFILVFLSLFVSFYSAAQSAQLRLFDTKGVLAKPAISLSSNATMTVTGLINHVVVTQRYKNINPFAVNARYVFPLSAESAVHAMTMRIGERVIKGQIDKKVIAEQKYQQAKQAGKHAALVSQQRANMFTTDVANIGPSEEVEITLEYQEIINYREGVFSIRFPTTITPRYHPINGTLENSHASEQTLPSGWLAPIFASSKPSLNNDHTPNTALFNLSIAINMGLELVDINAKHHRVVVSNNAFGQYEVLLNQTAELNRDFVLEFKPLQTAHAQAAFFTQEHDLEQYGLAMLLPPSDYFSSSQRLPREMVFVVDTSGSMHGQSIEQAKSALYYALSLLDSDDSFNIIAFDNLVNPMSEMPLVANDFNLRRAERFVYGLKADGGTEIQGALNAVLDGSQLGGFVRQVVFITDGSVSNEDALFKSISTHLGDSRLFTVGIGSAPNSYFMRRAADVGKGSFTFIGNTAEVQPKMQALFDKLAHPAITDLNLTDETGTPLDFWPSPLPDLYFGEPMMVAIKLGKTKNIVLSGQTAQGPLQIKLNSKNSGLAKGIDKLWARQKIKSLLLYNDKDKVKQQVQTLALTHQLLSPFTSFVAIEQSITNTIADRTIQAKNQLPQGMTIQLPQTDGQSRIQMLFGVIILLSLALIKFTFVGKR